MSLCLSSKSTCTADHNHTPDVEELLWRLELKVPLQFCSPSGELQLRIEDIRGLRALPHWRRGHTWSPVEWADRPELLELQDLMQGLNSREARHLLELLSAHWNFHDAGGVL